MAAKMKCSIYAKETGLEISAETKESQGAGRVTREGSERGK